MSDESIIEEKVGRPETSLEDKAEIVRKLRPYLQAGLSIRKSCLEAKVPKSTVYDLIQKDETFSDEIKQAQQFVSVLLSDVVTKQLYGIVKKQQGGQALTRDDLDFLKWFATSSNATKEEYGERKNIGLYDPEAEIQRLAGLIDESTEDKGDQGGSKK